jgi:hypothetical protein
MTRVPTSGRGIAFMAASRLWDVARTIAQSDVDASGAELGPRGPETDDQS